MRCPNCNNAIADSSASCIFCAAKSATFGHDEDIEVNATGTDYSRSRPYGLPIGVTIVLSFAAGVLLAGLGLWGYWLIGNRENKELNTRPMELEAPITAAEEVVEIYSALHQPDSDPKNAFNEDVSAHNGASTLPSIKIPATEPFIHPSRMNVLYRGVYNPINVHVPGYDDSQITLTATNGTLGKDAKGWNVLPGVGPTTAIDVNLTRPDGSSRRLGSVTLRVKNVPNPQPYFAGKSLNDETISKAELMAAMEVSAKMTDFDFDLSFEIVEYKLTMIVGGTPIETITKGAALSSNMKEMFQKAKPGQKIYIEGIKVQGPDGSVRIVGALAFKVI